jgi:hypothetical protein
MQCPQCNTYPINPRSKHKLCIRCGYAQARQKRNEERAKQKLSKPKIVQVCPVCQKKYNPVRSKQKFCSPSCKTKDKNIRWSLENPEKKPRRLSRKYDNFRLNPNS